MLYPKIGIRPVIDGRWGGVRESLENQTMRMAENAAKLISENLKYPDGTPVQCVIGCTTIGGGAEAARVAEQFSTQNVTATLSVTPCWCYGTETFDMDPNTIKAVWGFNGTERPGAVYLAAVLAAHAQRGLPAFSIYGHDVQEANDDTIPDDVAEKILRFARGAVAAGWMKNKAYVNIGAVTMGIAGSFCDAGVLQKYFGIRAEWVDEVEILRRISIGIYDHDEYEKALAWVRENCKEGFDKNLGKNLPPVITKSKIVPADKDWEFIVKMTLIIRDILYDNPRLDEMGWHEEALGRNAVVGGFQGQRQWTDWLPNADFTEAIMASTFDWNGPKAPIPFATENDTCNGIAMMLGSLVSGSAPCFHDVRTYWSPEACERVTGQKPVGFYFHYMPVGNEAAPELMPSPEQRKYMIDRIRYLRSEACDIPFYPMDFQNDGEFVGGCIAGGRNYCHINANGDVEPCVFIHYSGANIRDMSLLDALKQPLFMSYRDNQPFNNNHLRPCPMLENPELLEKMVKETGAKSTDLESPESAEHLCGKCVEYAANWAGEAQQLWTSCPHHVAKHTNYKSDYTK